MHAAALGRCRRLLRTGAAGGYGLPQRGYGNRAAANAAAAAPEACLDGGEAEAEGEGALAFAPRLLQKGRRGQKGSLVLTRCEGLAYGGKGICRMPNGKVLFVKSAYPGEYLTATVVSAKKGVAEGRKVLSLAAAPAPEDEEEHLLRRRFSGRHAMAPDGKPAYHHDNAVDAPCPHFLDGCGGCSFQSLEYEAQLREKGAQMLDTFTRIGGFSCDADTGGLYLERGGDGARAREDVRVGPIVGCAAGRRYRYRNKMEFSFSSREWVPHREVAEGEGDWSQDREVFALGLHAPGSFAKVLRVDACLLQHEVADGILAMLRGELERLGFSCYDSLTHEGYLRVRLDEIDRDPAGVCVCAGD